MAPDKHECTMDGTGGFIPTFWTPRTTQAAGSTEYSGVMYGPSCCCPSRVHVSGCPYRPKPEKKGRRSYDHSRFSAVKRRGFK